MGISGSEQGILDWLAQQDQATVSLLAATVSVHADSYNEGGIDAVGADTHTPDEFCRLGTMVPRAYEIALTVTRGGA